VTYIAAAGSFNRSFFICRIRLLVFPKPAIIIVYVIKPKGFTNNVVKYLSITIWKSITKIKDVPMTLNENSLCLASRRSSY
jgi:hypothetical protein